MARGAINVQITGDYNDKDIKRAMRDLDGLRSQGGPAAKSMFGVSDAFKSIALAAGAFVGLRAIKDFVADSIQQGSALEESLSKNTAVFGEQADAIVAWSQDSATAFGQSQQSALEAAGTFGNLLQAFGVTRAEAARMSQDITELAADLASFNNTSVDDALTALRAGLSGETEPLKRYGIALNDARLKTIAFEKGLYSGKGQLDVTAKSLAAFELIMRDSALAQGDFARTSDGFANQMRILEATIDNLKASFGIGLIDGFMDGIKVGDELNDSLANLDEAATDLGTTLGHIGGEAAVAAAGFLDIAAGVVEMKQALDETQGSADAFGPGGWGLTIERWFASIFLALTGAGDGVRDYQSSLESLARQEEAMVGRYRDSQNALRDTADAADEATEATNHYTEAMTSSNDAMSFVTTRNNLLEFYANLKDQLDGNKRTLDGMGESAINNQNLLVEAFTKAGNQADAWAKKTGASATETRNYFDNLASDIVDQFVDQGFKRSDVEGWLGEQGIWTGPLLDRIDRSEHRARREAHEAGVSIGDSMARGMAYGLSETEIVNMEAARLVRNAERAARREAESQSPSRLFARIGNDLILGLVAGMQEKNSDAEAFAKKLPENLEKAFRSRLDAFRSVVNEQLQIIDSAKAAINSYADAVVNSVVGSLDFATTDAEGKPLTPEQMVNMLLGDISNRESMVQSLVNSGIMTQLPEALAQKILSLPPDAAKALVDYLAANPEALAKLTQNYQALADYTLTALGIPMGQAFATIGDESASKAIDKAKAKIKNRSGEFKSWVKDKLQTTITIDVRYRVVGDIPSPSGRAGDLVVGARGGIVNRPTFALIGEAGPEAVVPLDRTAGNDPLPMVNRQSKGGPSNITINVNAGMGTDGAEVGRQIADALKAYERRNGPVYVAA